MPASRTLKKRIARTFLLLAFILSTFFSLVTYLSMKVIEDQLIDQRLDKLADKLIAQYRHNQVVDTPPDVEFFVGEAIPEALRGMPQGVHERWLDERVVVALAREEENSRFVIALEATRFEHMEIVIFAALGAGFASSLLLAVVLGRGTVRHVIAPVTALAEAVARNASPASLPSIATDDEVGVLARNFARRTDELQQFLVRERLFTGDVSHELRTPLTIILGASELLQMQLADRPSQLAVAERIRRVASETAERVTAMLLLARAPETVEAPRIELNAVIRSEVDRCQHILLGKPVQCCVDCPERVWMDVHPELAAIAIGNLLRNACQHTDSGTIAIRLTKEQLVIEDSGPGLPVHVREHLFERFVHGSRLDANSSGLGLSIVKRVVEHIGWDIRLESPGEGGSRFILSFPLQGAGRR